MVALAIVYTAIDDNGERGSTTIHIPDSFSLSQIGEFGEAMATLVDAVLGGKVESADLGVFVDISALTSNTALSTSDVEEVGAFAFEAVGGFPVKVNIPAIDELMVLSGSDDIDQSDSDIAAFIALMESGLAVTGGTVIPCDVDENDITTTVYARERFRASGTRR